MKKILFWIFSAALAIAGTGTATAQQAARVHQNARSAAQVATVANPNAAKEVSFNGRVRSGVTSSMLQTPAVRPVADSNAANIMRAATGNVNLMGLMLYSEKEGVTKGVYNIPQNGDEPTQAFPASYNTAYSAELVGDTYYISDYYNLMGLVQYFRMFGYDVNTGEKVFEYSGNPDIIAFGMAYDRATGITYALGYNADASGVQLSTFTFGANTVSVNPIATMSITGWNTLFIDNAGQLYGIAYVTEGENVVNSELYKIDKTNGATELVGVLNVDPTYITDACVDPNTGVCYWTVSPADETGNLYTIDLATATATKVCTFPYGEEIVGLYVEKAAETGTPEKVSNLVATFPNGSMIGSVSFTAPTTNVDGAAGTGTLTYSLSIDGEEYETGTCAYGANVTINEIGVGETGYHDFSVKVANGNLVSKPEKTRIFVGYGVITAPKNVHASYENGTITLTWDAVNTSADGGYVNPADITYNVYRIVKGTEEATAAATGLTTCTFTDAVGTSSAFVTYAYRVEACYITGNVSATSNTIALGQLEPPYSNDFADASRMEEMIVVDVNADGKTWSLNSNAARIQFNTNMAMDDWMMTPLMKMEAGKAYKLTFKVKAQSTTWAERLGVYMGTSTDPAAMTTVVMEPTDITWNTFEEMEFMLAPATTGTYSIGFHGCSDKDKYYLYVDDIEVAAGVAATAPGMPTNLTVTPDPTGAYKGTVSFNAPSVDFANNALTSNLTEIVVKRDGNVVKTYTNVAPGAECTFVDEVGVAGTVTYTVQASNADGAGLVATVSQYIGTDAPAATASVTLVENGNTGEVTITWEAVTTDQNGNPIDPSKVTYGLYLYASNSRTPIVTGTTALSHTFQAVPEGQQDLQQYAVWATTEGGEGQGVLCRMTFIGTPYTDYADSFANGGVQHDMMIEAINNLGNATVKLCTDESFTDINSQDGDNGFAATYGKYLDEAAALNLGKISLVGLVNPGLTFYTYNINGGVEGTNPDINEIKVEARECGTEEYTTVFQKSVVEIGGDVNDWVKVTVGLGAFEGKNVQIRITGIVKQYTYTMIDNMKVASMIGNDMRAHSVAAPGRVNAGSDYEATVKVMNEGYLDATAYTVELYLHGEKVASVEKEGLASGASELVTFPMNMHVLAEDAHALHAVVVYAADENLANNTTEVANVNVKLSTLPKVDDLAGELVAEGAKLTWSEPNLEGSAEEKTEDFEGFEAFAQEIEGWTFVDVDGSPVGGMQNTDIPGITPGTTPASFFVFNQEGVGGNATFDGHSGIQYLAAMFRYDDGQADDWAISPALSGNAQTISFWAKSYSATYPEKIAVLYSTGSLEPADFIATEVTDKVLGDTWTEVTVDLPAGAAYFAIRSYAAGAFMLMIDDVTYEAGSATANLNITGYNVYRNNEKINAEPVAENEFVDANAPEGTNNYRVTAVYDRGESAGSNTATVEVSGLSDVEAGISIVAEAQAIVITGAEGQAIVINDVAGRTIFAAEGTAVTTVPVSQGVYVVKAAGKVVKVIVK